MATVYGDLKENAIEFYRGDKVATGSFTTERFKTKIKSLAEKYPDECQIVAENDDGSICCHFPVKWVKVAPPKKIEMSEERKNELRERLAAARNKNV